MADCALTPGLFMVENVLPATGVDNPIPAHANVAAYWAAIQANAHAARTLVELHRGLEERREMIRSGAFDKRMAEMAAAHAAAAQACARRRTSQEPAASSISATAGRRGWQSGRHKVADLPTRPGAPS
jgi:hypothetical protein